MFFYDIAVWPIIGAAAASMALGFVWYSPWLFGKRWLAEMNITPESMQGMFGRHAVSAVLSLITAFVVSALLNSLIVPGMGSLLLLAFLVWIAFSVPVGANDVLYGKKSSCVLFAINAGYNLISIAFTVLIIGVFG